MRKTKQEKLIEYEIVKRASEGDVDAINSPSYRIRKKYRVALDKASILPENENDLPVMYTTEENDLMIESRIIQFKD